MARIQSVRFVAYHAPAAPAGRTWLAVTFETPNPTEANPNPAEVALPVQFVGSSRDAVLAGAERLWTADRSTAGKPAKRNAEEAA